MTTDTLSGRERPDLSSPETSAARAALDNIAYALTSLKLTVALFALAIVLIFIGTLAQVTMDMWEVISLYFRAWICWIEAPVFFPRSWFPDLPEARMRTIVALLLLTGALVGGIPCFARRGRSWLWPLAASLPSGTQRRGTSSSKATNNWRNVKSSPSRLSSRR